MKAIIFYVIDSISCKTRNHLQTIQTTHKLSKPPTKHPQTTNKQATNQPNYRKTIHKNPIMSRKSVFYVTKFFSDNAKYVLRLQSFWAITLTFSSEDQS